MYFLINVVFILSGTVYSVLARTPYTVKHDVNSPTVKTSCGLVEGVKTSFGSYVFKGIPYAEPPIGDLRWKRPKPFCWKDTFKADSYGNSCMQRGLLDNTKIIGSEDCLFLNVWTPSIDNDANLPVMVWIHGGFLEYLNGNWPTYMPSGKLARDTNMVYVSMNYRLNAFGFLALEILSEDSDGISGNYGFMDQILALRWVKRNINSFGGNPNLVTIFGQSSGGTSIFALLASPLSKGLFHRAWMISASAKLEKPLAEASRDNLVFLNNTGCVNVACLKSLRAEDVLKAIPWDVYPFWAMSDLMDLPTYGILDGALAVVDGYVIPQAPLKAWERGDTIDVPVMIGTTAQEIDVFPIPTDIKSWDIEKYRIEVTRKMSKFPGLNIPRIFELYHQRHQDDTPEYLYTSMASDLRVTCPNNKIAFAIGETFKNPVFRYISTAKPQNPTQLFGFPFNASYAAHGWDCFAFFDTIREFYPPTAADEQFKNNIQREIHHFVIYGRPATEKWRQFPDTALIDDLGVISSRHYLSQQCRFWLDNGFFSYSWIN